MFLFVINKFSDVVEMKINNTCREQKHILNLLSFISQVYSKRAWTNTVTLLFFFINGTKTANLMGLGFGCPKINIGFLVYNNESVVTYFHQDHEQIC